MSARLKMFVAAALAFSLTALAPAAAQAATPAWTATITPMPANFSAGVSNEYFVVATNVGAASTAGAPSVLRTTLPVGIKPVSFQILNSDQAATNPPTCVIAVQVLTCETTEAVHPGRRLLAKIGVEVTATEGTLDATVNISGGGASNEASAIAPTPIQSGSVPFGFLAGFIAPLTDEDGAAATLAGSHPYQQTLAFGFPTEDPGEGVTNAGHPRDFTVDLPRGMVGSPAATPVLCTEAQLTMEECPEESQVGIADVTTLLVAKQPTIFTTALYNMVPPPGTPAELGTDVAHAGLFSHIRTDVRSDDDYGVEASAQDVLAFGQQPIFNLQSQLWGDPSAEAHDPIRGVCAYEAGTCPPVPRQKAAFLTLPGDCPGQPLPFKIFADSWEEPAPQFKERETSYESADLTGAPVSVEDCGSLEFEPSIQARLTTNLTDSPSGLDVTVHQPQDTDFESRAPATLRDAAITFPASLAINPAQAAGLGACSEAQVGFEEEDEEGVLHFSRDPQSCPAAAKIGSLEASSPLLVRRNAEHETEEDEGKPVLEPLHGSVYIAEPFKNPFGSLIAVYLVVEDEQTGIVAKLAGEGELDPNTGQLTTYVEEAPELPIEDFKVHVFGGARGAFVTPPTCGKFTTEAELLPWSAPEGQEAFPEDEMQAAATPLGGTCPSAPSQLPNAPKLSAGTLNPTAGAYSPLLFKLSREDGTQRLGKIEATLPTGLSAKLAGVATCSEADIAKARSREAPQKGVLEQADPSCPATSQIGVVNAAAGAGPNPYYTQGHAYLAGPYKGAPISIVAIAPAVAGPFDLGTVVVRSALYLDPNTAQARIVSDPLPQILEGIPIDLRSVAVRADRPSFSLNPTSCAEKSFGGQALSVLGAPAPLAERFQVGGCKSLPYKPKLTARLSGPIHRGGHPSFRAELTAKPGEANTAAFSLTLPSSEFIDQAHFRTICTRVQFAASQCPAGSVYGYVKARSPLVDYTLEGPVYLRSSSHKLPDAVAALRGPASQPIEIDAVARIDSVNGGLRSRVEIVPDAPITKVIVSLQGGKKGLFQNSTNICKGTHRMKVSFTGQNGKVNDFQPALKAKCKGNAKGKGGGKKHR